MASRTLREDPKAIEAIKATIDRMTMEADTGTKHQWLEQHWAARDKRESREGLARLNSINDAKNEAARHQRETYLNMTYILNNTNQLKTCPLTVKLANLPIRSYSGRRRCTNCGGSKGHHMYWLGDNQEYCMACTERLVVIPQIKAAREQGVSH